MENRRTHTGSVRTFYYDKKHKKNRYKQVSLSKFGGDESKAKEFLENWRQSQLRKQNEAEITDVKEELEEEIADVKEELEEEIAEIKEELNRENLKEEIADTVETELNQTVLACDLTTDKSYKIHYVPFRLELSEQTGTTTAIFGSSKSGKTVQLMKIIKKYYDKPDFITILIAENIHSKSYKDLSKKILRMSYFDETLIKNLHRINKRTKNRYKFCIIFDDIILHKNNSAIMSLILTMRNANFSSVLLFQSVTLLAKTNRQNINNAIFKRQNNNEAIEIVMKDYLGGYEPFYGKSMDDKIRLYREATNDYKFIYLNALSDQISFCKP